jgi:predicted CXXCH cytochrome family protein
MKQKLAVMVLLSLVATSAFAQYTAVGKVKNSKHDLSSGSTSVVKSSDLNQICAFCHVAHKSPTAPAGIQAPLWNRSLGTTLTGTYGGTSTFTALSTDIAALGAATWGTATLSHLCMSCHDGSVGVNATYKLTATVGAIAGHTDAASKLIGDAKVGTDMASSHPVNFTYQGAAWLASQTHVAVPTSNRVGPANLPLDNNGKLQCSTCHTVHDATNPFFLRDTLNGSQLCLDCHLST